MLKDILKARVYEVAKRTPLEHASRLSSDLGQQIFIKREDLQPIFSFKIRGAYNRIAAMSEDQRARGVICASAGNHGQGVALAAQRLGIPAWVVMPTTTPEIKVKAVASFGANVVLAGDHYSEAYERSLELVAATGATMIHPFDDPLVIAGQATVGKEILEDCPHVDMVFVPVGGGGLLAGVAAYIKALAPHVKIFGVEPRDSDAMVRSVESGERITLTEVGIFADGVAVKRVGDHTFTIVRDLVDGFVRVSTDEICSAIHDIYLETRTLVEPAGALSWAGAKKLLGTTSEKNLRVVTISSGANMNFQRLPFVAERALTGAGLESLFAVKIPERPGSLKALCGEILEDTSITEFNYRKGGLDDAYILLGIATQSRDDHGVFKARLNEYGYHFVDLTDNDLAKDHVRHMVGGKAQYVTEEELYSFVFPERPGALSGFLAVLSQRWNISLFHYRCHGADYGRVLIAFEVSSRDRDEFERGLKEIGYPFVRETENPAYRLLLSDVSIL